jgi:hypothetical protein
VKGIIPIARMNRKTRMNTESMKMTADSREPGYFSIVYIIKFT